MLLKELASLVNGSLVGDGTVEITGLSTIEDAGAGDLAFVLEDKNLAGALGSKASAIVFSDRLEIGGRPGIRVKEPRLAMLLILRKFDREPELEPGIHPSAFVHPSARIGQAVSIGPFSYVGPGSEIGDGTVIYPNVTIYEKVKIGRHCRIHAGTRIGVDGYGFMPAGKKHEKIPQIGGVIIGDDVELFANVTVARSTMGNTVIGSGTKVDCLCHIAHNCRIGENCAIVSLVGLAGSITVKDHVTIGGQAGFSGHLTIGENAVVLARSGVTKDVPANAIVSGFPAMDHKKELERQASLRRLLEKNKK